MHIASQAGHPDTTLVFLKKGVPLHMPNKVHSLEFVLRQLSVTLDILLGGVTEL